MPPKKVPRSANNEKDAETSSTTSSSTSVVSGGQTEDQQQELASDSGAVASDRSSESSSESSGSGRRMRYDLGQQAPETAGEKEVRGAAPVEQLLHPCQPRDHVFPGSRSGEENFLRSFQPLWFDKWKWLHYDIESDSVFCFGCLQAVQKKLVTLDLRGGAEVMFVGKGFSNWRKATERFNSHEKSQTHRDAVRTLSALEKTPISALLSDIAAKEQQTARRVLEILFSNISFLGRKGLPFRGDTMRDGVLYELMLERTYNLPLERQWMTRRDNWMSNTIQNKIITQFAHAVQNTIVTRAKDCEFYGLTADGTTDISTTEQFSCCLQYVSKNDLTTHRDFLGFYNCPDTTAETLFTCLKDVLLRLNIPITQLGGYCFDGAYNMSGRLSGVQARLKEVSPHSLYVHCCNHSLDLVLQEVGREVSLIAEGLNFVQGVAVLIKESAKRKQLLQSLFECDDVVVNILGLCPTRWCVRTKALERVCSAYPVLLSTLESLKEDRSLRGETRAKINGLHKAALKGKTLFSLLCCKALFAPCEVVAKTLQNKNASALGAIECVNLLLARVKALRADSIVTDIINNVKTQVTQSGLKMPDETENRTSKTPARYRHTTDTEALSQVTYEVRWRMEFFEAVDLVSAELSRRFDQDGMTVAVARERTVINAANGHYSMAEVMRTRLNLPPLFDRDRLHLQLSMLKDVLHETHPPYKTVQEVASSLSKVHSQTRTLFGEVEKLIKLCLSLPISVANSERSFSTLRRLKTWLRSSMSQKRLTHLAIMHVHSDIVEKLDIQDMIQTFISVNPERKKTFGVLK